MPVVLRRAALDRNGRPVPRGTTGRVVDRAPYGAYLVRLADGRQVGVRREHLSLRRADQRVVPLVPRAIDPFTLVREHTIYAAVLGSRAYGLARRDSDADVRGVYLPPPDTWWSLTMPPSQVLGPDLQQVSWELERCCELALEANPILLEALHSPLVVTCTPVGRELLDLREAFLSQLAAQTYSRHALAQFKRIESDLRRRRAPRWKHVMHLLRFLLSATGLVETGRLTVDAGPHRERLLAVRRGEVPWDDVERWRQELHRTLETALDRTPLPATPDTARVDAWLRSVRRRAAEGELP